MRPIKRTEVLIVDDDPVAIEVLRDQLSGGGFRIQATGEWSGTNRILLETKVAVLILDINLPGLKGNTLADIVQKNLSLPPAIVLHSGIPEEELRRLARRARATNCIPKGTAQEEVVRIIRAAAEEFERRSQAQQTERQTHPPPPPRS